jgi:hypothetical protein
MNHYTYLRKGVSLAVAGVAFALLSESFGANISTSLTTRRVEARAQDFNVIFNPSVFSGVDGVFISSVSATAGAASASASQDSNISLISDILSVSGEGAAEADSPGTVDVFSESEANIFVEFSVSAPTPFSFSATTTLDGVGAARAFLINLNTATTIVGSFGTDAAALSGVLLPGFTYQVEAGAEAGQSSGSATWDLNFTLGARGVPDAGATGFLLALSALGLAGIRRRMK